MGCSSTTSLDASSLPGRGPSLWNTEGDEPEEVDEVDVLGYSSDSDIPLGQARAVSVSEEGEHDGEPHQFRGLIERAAQALGSETGAGNTPAPSRFDEDSGRQSAPFSVPLLSDVEELMRAGFARPTAPLKFPASCRRLSAMQDREKVGCAALPQMDQSIAALLFPTNSVLGKATCPSKHGRMLDAMLAKVHRAMAVQAQLANTASILALYHRLLTRKLDMGDGEGLTSELQLVSSTMARLMKEQAAAAGKGLASLWVTRRQLWLSQSRLQPEDQNGLLGLPLDSLAMFGPGANSMLQQTQEVRRCAREVSGALLRRRR